MYLTPIKLHIYNQICYKYGRSYTSRTTNRMFCQVHSSRHHHTTNEKSTRATYTIYKIVEGVQLNGTCGIKEAKRFCHVSFGSTFVYFSLRSQWYGGENLGAKNVAPWN